MQNGTIPYGGAFPLRKTPFPPDCKGKWDHVSKGKQKKKNILKENILEWS